jgi:alkyldihydroxyacetonephosphate synthase
MSSQILQALEAIVGASHVSGKPPSQTAWVVRPGSASEISELIRLANTSGYAVVPVGAATRAAATPDSDRVCLQLDMKRMDHVLHLDETSLVAHVQAGLTALELEKILAPRGLSIGDYPPSTLRSSVGGLLAVRTPGKASRRHGFFEDAVIGISAVLADGKTIHTRVAPRRATGPDLARALCGSEGTLGVITSAVLRIHRRPEARLLASFSLPTFEDAIRSVNLALREEAAPAAMRICDAREARAQFGFESDDDRAILLVATAGPTDLAACDRNLVASAVEASGGEAEAEDIAQAWSKSRTGQTPAPALPSPSLQISATPGRQIDVYRAIAEAAAAAGLTLRAYGSRFDVDGGVFFFTFLDASGQPIAPGEQLEQLAHAADSAGAFLLGASNTSLTPYFAELRRRLDPNNVLNPSQQL